MRVGIKAHQSFYATCDILHRDIPSNNIIVTESATTDGFKGMLIDPVFGHCLYPYTSSLLFFLAFLQPTFSSTCSYTSPLLWRTLLFLVVNIFLLFRQPLPPWTAFLSRGHGSFSLAFELVLLTARLIH